METINTETVVSSLFKVGFDKVDPILYTFVLAKISMDDKKQLFKFKDQKTSLTFDKLVDYNGLIFKLKDGLQMDTNVSVYNGLIFKLKDDLQMDTNVSLYGVNTQVGNLLITNHNLIKYLNNLDFSEIVLKKAETYGMQNIDESTFSNKELKILSQLNINNVNNKILSKKML